MGPIYFNYNKSIFDILNILSKEGYLWYEIIRLNSYKFKLVIYKNGLNSLKILKDKKRLSYKLITLEKDSYSFIFNTSKGYLIDKEAIRLKIGGIKWLKFN